MGAGRQNQAAIDRFIYELFDVVAKWRELQIPLAKSSCN
jgi:hypothetical protein